MFIRTKEWGQRSETWGKGVNCSDGQESVYMNAKALSFIENC